MKKNNIIVSYKHSDNDRKVYAFLSEDDFKDGYFPVEGEVYPFDAETGTVHAWPWGFKIGVFIEKILEKELPEHDFQDFVVNTNVYSPRTIKDLPPRKILQNEFLDVFLAVKEEENKDGEKIPRFIKKPTTEGETIKIVKIF